MRKLLLTLCLGLSLMIFPFWFINSTPAIAATVQEETAKSKLDLPEAIAQFLTTIPHDYYTLSNVDSLKKTLKNNQALLVDVRQPSEYASGHIPGAINIPLRTLTQNLDKIPPDRPVVLYCTTGYRTAMGVTALQMLGYSNVQGFPPSIQGWQAAREPLEK
ncbi:rhodanese-like domain-containing protein [Oscillatoria salina]|uniref:rhodanese-like domain-containing protein n=1 Tax=Oscillatoria salina TaxID=331517 RepID=UPI0013BAD594|nr:rhodanese-like domain-containing protein [Oscillatoria salina]MBZ8179451.1 rhodanese-like domain-containing protein [Oscillatoria salina IIICB1]NET89108.1 rhodanese-like domain-containing protein [Kamptonema sp. SIO1D9]